MLYSWVDEDPSFFFSQKKEIKNYNYDEGNIERSFFLQIWGVCVLIREQRISKSTKLRAVKISSKMLQLFSMSPYIYATAYQLFLLERK